MNIKSFLVFLLLFVLTTSCLIQQEDTISEIVVLDNFPLRISMDSLIENREFVVLETNEQSVIRELSKVLLINDTIVVGDYRQGNILLFRKDGSFIRCINHLGKGPGEYIHISGLSYDQKTRELVVLNLSTSSIVRYSLSDRIGKTERFNAYDSGTDMVVFKDYFVFMRSCNVYPNNPKHNVSVLNRDFKYVTSGVIIPDQISDLFLTIRRWSDVHEESLYITAVGCDTIFSIGKDGRIRPRYKVTIPERLDVKKSELWRHNHTDMLAFTKSALYAGMIWQLKYFFVLDECIVFSFGGRGAHYCFYWKNSGELTRIDSPHYTSEEIYLNIIGKTGDRLIAYVNQAAEFAKVRKVLGNVVPEESNPVLCFIKLKQKS